MLVFWINRRLEASELPIWLLPKVLNSAKNVKIKKKENKMAKFQQKIQRHWRSFSKTNYLFNPVIKALAVPIPRNRKTITNVEP